jgi:hypothetical protein
VSLKTLFLLFSRSPVPQALFLQGFPRSLLAAQLAQPDRALVTPRFAAHLCPLVLLVDVREMIPLV